MADLTAEQWLDIFTATDRAGKLSMAGFAAQKNADAARGHECVLASHDERLADSDKRQVALIAVLDELHAGMSDFSEAAQAGVQAVINRIASTIRYHL